VRSSPPRIADQILSARPPSRNSLSATMTQDHGRVEWRNRAIPPETTPTVATEITQSFQTVPDGYSTGTLNESSLFVLTLL
jgi:hypothetical protein